MRRRLKTGGEESEVTGSDVLFDGAVRGEWGGERVCELFGRILDLVQGVLVAMGGWSVCIARLRARTSRGVQVEVGAGSIGPDDATLKS